MKSSIDIFLFLPLVLFSLSNLLVTMIIKIVTSHNSWLSTILYFLNVENQLNSKNLQMKLCMHLPKFHPQHFFKLSVLYIPVHILGSYIWNLVVQFPIFYVRFFLDQVCYSNAIKWRMHQFLLLIYLYFFQWTDSHKSCIKLHKSYLNSQKIEIKFNLEILFYAVFIGKLQDIHLFKNSHSEMFCK